MFALEKNSNARMDIMTRNTMDEDWDERRDGGKDVPEYELRDFTKILLRNGKEHTSYYHYTNWGAFGKMMEEVKGGPARGLRMLLLSPANKTNDGIERCWGQNVYLACFSYSRYEDVAMWMNYGKRSPDAVRIRFDGRKVRAWLERHRERKGFFKAISGGDGFSYEQLNPDDVDSVKLVDVAYVIPSRMTRGRFRGNVEYSRDFYRVVKNGTMDWSDSIYDGNCSAELSPYFKKRGWCYEREMRLVVTLKDGVDLPERLAVSFCGPFDDLERQMRTGGDGLMRNVLAGPWFDQRKSSQASVCGVALHDVGKSDYAKEIRIIAGCDCDTCTIKKNATEADKSTMIQCAEVKILACCDLHQCGLDSVDPSGCDIAIIAGDMLSKGSYPAVQPPKSHIDKQIAWVNDTLIPWCEKYKKTQFVIVAGNCDEFALTSENPLCHLPKGTNIHYLQDSMVEIKGVKIWGTPWTKPKHKRLGHPNKYRMFEKSAEFLSAAYSKMPSGIDVLVSHSTPAVPDSWIVGDPANKFGNETLTSCIEEKVPTVCVCGHIHSSEHRPVVLGNTVVMNVSVIRDTDRYHAAYKPRIFTMSKGGDSQWRCEYDASDDLRI